MHLEKLDLNLLVAIDALLRTQSVTAAADELNLTQSAISSALNRARAHFGDEILYYDGQKMCPSPLGQSIAAIVPEMMTRLRALSRMRANSDMSSVKRQFTIIASDYVSAVYLSVVSKRLSVLAPNVSLAMVPFSEDAVDGFMRGKIDFLIAPSNFAVTAKNLRARLFEDEFQCVMCNDNPLVKTGLTMDSFLTSPHVVTDFFVGVGKSHFESWLLAMQFDIKIAASLPSFVVLPHFISGTMNIATIHKRLIKQLGPMGNLTAITPPCEVPNLIETLIWQDHQRYDTEATLIRDLMLEIGRDF